MARRDPAVPSAPETTCEQIEQMGLDAALRLIAERIDAHRVNAGRTTEGIAHSSGLTIATVREIRQLRSDPHLSTLLKLCTGLGITSTELLSDLPLLPAYRK